MKRQNSVSPAADAAAATDGADDDEAVELIVHWQADKTGTAEM